MPLLQTVNNTGGNLAKAVLVLRDAQTYEGIQEKFDQICHEGVRRLERRPLRPDHPVSSLIPLPSAGNLIQLI